MRFRFLILLSIVSLLIMGSCDSTDSIKILKFQTDTLLPQAAVNSSYDFTFKVRYGDDLWDENSGYLDSDIVWGFDSWTRNGVTQSSGPANITFSEGIISGTADSSDIALWSFVATIQKGKKLVSETFYLPIVNNVVIKTDSVLPIATTDLDYMVYFKADLGQAPYYWQFDNWSKDGNPVSNPPSGLVVDSTGTLSGLADNSTIGKWTFDVTVYDTSIPNQLSTSKSFELYINIKISVPSNFPTIQDAVDYAKDGDVIYLENGTLQGNGNRDVEFSGKSLTIIGNPSDPSTVVIDCEGTTTDPHRAFSLTMAEKSCVLDGFKIVNGSAPEKDNSWRGGAIYLEDKIELTIQNVIFEDIKTIQQTTDTYGGLLYADESCTIVMKNIIANNICAEADDDLYGQLIYTDENTTIDLENCIFDGGVGASEEYRGLLHLDHSTYNLKNVIFRNLEPTSRNDYYNYGMFYIIYGSGMWENVYVVNNKSVCGKGWSNYAYNYGLGYYDHTEIIYKNFVYANNEYEYEGSSSYWYFYSSYHYYGTSRWSDCIFANNLVNGSNNICRIYGSLLKLYYNKAELKRMYFIQNIANSNYSYTGTSYTGGIQIDGSSSEVVLNECIFAHNMAGLGSAGISKVYSSSDLVINNCTFYKNTGYFGGALFFYGNTTVNNSIFWDNSATISGNQIYGYSSSYTCDLNNSCYRNQGNDISGNIKPINCVTSDPYFKETGVLSVTGDCTFSSDEMIVKGTLGTSIFLTEIMCGDLIYLTVDGYKKALTVIEVLSDTELKVAGYYKGTIGTGAASVTKCNFNLQHTNKGDANDSPCVDSGDDSKTNSFKDIANNSRYADGNGNSTSTIDMGAYELQ